MKKNLRSIGYLKLLKKNQPFRNLWYGQVVSELGDWLNSIAIFALVLKLDGSGMTMAAVMTAKLLPVFFVSPFAGILIDRMDRKRVMFVSDILRFLVVLCFLFIHDKSQMWLLYTLVVIEISLAGFFEPARSAIIPSLTKKEDLVTANALSGSTWSVMLAFGAAMGGVIVSLFGIKTAFVVDACTFLVSAWFISRVRAPEKIELSEKDPTRAGGFKSFLQGMNYLRSKPTILALTLLKPGLAISGGFMTIIPLYAHQLLSNPSSVSMAIGIMYSVRGLGAAVGPVLVRLIFGESRKVLQGAVLAGYFMTSVFFFLLAESNSLWAASLSLGFATLCGSIIWVFSSAMIHQQAKEKFLGRVFSLDWALLTLVMGGSNWCVGYAIDQMGLTPNEAARWIGVALIFPGILWGGFLIIIRRQWSQIKAVRNAPSSIADKRNLPPTSL
ncbi:MAG: MFS transporter [Nitrospinales bacterium]